MIQKSIQCWSSQMLASIIDDSIATHTISSPTRIADIHHTPTTILDLDSCTSEIIPTPLPWPVEATIKKHYSATVLVLQALAAAMKERYHSSSESANDTFVPVDSTIAPVFLANASEDAFPFLPFPLLFAFAVFAFAFAIFAFALRLDGCIRAIDGSATVLGFIECKGFVHTFLGGILDEAKSLACALFIQGHSKRHKLTTLSEIFGQRFFRCCEWEASDKDGVFILASIFALAFSLCGWVSSFHTHLLCPSAVLAALGGLSKALVPSKLLIVSCGNPIFIAVDALVRVIFPLLVVRSRSGGGLRRLCLGMCFFLLGDLGSLVFLGSGGGSGLRSLRSLFGSFPCCRVILHGLLGWLLFLLLRSSSGCFLGRLRCFLSGFGRGCCILLNCRLFGRDSCSKFLCFLCSLCSLLFCKRYFLGVFLDRHWKLGYCSGSSEGLLGFLGGLPFCEALSIDDLSGPFAKAHCGEKRVWAGRHQVTSKR